MAENQQLSSHPVAAIFTSGLAEAMRKTLVASLDQEAESAGTSQTQDIIEKFAMHVDSDPVMGRKIINHLLLSHIEDIAVHSDKNTKKAKTSKKDS